MNSEYFKEEFNKLLRQLEMPKDKNNLSATPLTKQEIFDAVQEVLESKLDVTLVDSTRNEVKTPASTIFVTTPDAPDIPKINVKQIGDISERFQSLDSMVVGNLTNSSNVQLNLAERDLLIPKVEENNNGFAFDLPDARFEEGKFMSKSSPAVCALARSDTFVREDKFQGANNGDVFEEKKIDSVTTTHELGIEQCMPGIKLIDIFNKLKTLKHSLTDVINKIDDIQNDTSDNIRPIRRLSAMGSFPGLARTSKLSRRSLVAFHGTPTSSRLSLGTSGTKDAAPMRSKSTSTISLVNNGGSTCRSVSSGALTLPKESQSSGVRTQKTLGLRSPSSSLVNRSDRSVIRKSINSQYPRVQNATGKSGIALGKRKAN